MIMGKKEKACLTVGVRDNQERIDARDHSRGWHTRHQKGKLPREYVPPKGFRREEFFPNIDMASKIIQLSWYCKGRKDKKRMREPDEAYRRPFQSGKIGMTRVERISLN